MLNPHQMSIASSFRTLSRGGGTSNADSEEDIDGIAAGGASDMEAVEDAYTCFACEQAAGLEDLKEAHGGHFFHARCWAAHRAYLRSVAGSAEQINKHKHNMIHNPAVWRAAVKPFVASDQKSRQGARTDAKRVLLETSSTDHVKAKEKTTLKKVTSTKKSVIKAG